MYLKIKIQEVRLIKCLMIKLLIIGFLSWLWLAVFYLSPLEVSFSHHSLKLR